MIFFNRSYFVLDQLDGLIDIHNHLLPNIDDGAPDIDTTVNMIKAYRDCGFHGVYTTPHTMEDYINRGAVLQLNLLSLTQHYGKSVNKKAIELLKNNLYSFVGTDAHRTEHLHKIKEAKIKKELVDNLKNITDQQNSLFT